MWDTKDCENIPIISKRIKSDAYMSIHIQEKDYDIGALCDLRWDMQVTSRMDVAGTA